MTRVSATLLVQQVDTHYVIVDERTGAEILLPRREAARVAYVLVTVFGILPEGPESPQQVTP